VVSRCEQAKKKVQDPGGAFGQADNESRYSLCTSLAKSRTATNTMPSAEQCQPAKKIVLSSHVKHYSIIRNARHAFHYLLFESKYSDTCTAGMYGETI
jgi:hypothetical protein